MNTGSFNIVNVSLIVVGGVLIYCGVKDVTPKAALQQIIAGSKAGTPVAGTPASKPGRNAAPKSPTSGGGGGIKPAVMGP